MSVKLEEDVKRLEERVASLKDYKKLYEEAEAKRVKAEKALEAARSGGDALKKALLNLLDLDNKQPAGSVTVSENWKLQEKELVVTLEHEEVEVSMTTDTGEGKVMFLALKEMPKEGFSSSEISAVLLQHGWNIPDSTLGARLGDLTRQGYLVKLEGKPLKYRVPAKVKFNVSEQ